MNVGDVVIFNGNKFVIKWIYESGLCFGPFDHALLSGCWSRMEVKDLAFVTAAGIDKIEKNMIKKR